MLVSNDGLMTATEGNEHHVHSYNQICAEYDEAGKEWVAELRDQGYVAAHPNDGWVDRDEKRFSLVYPHFQDKEVLQTGDPVMLGWHSDPKSQRPVIVIGRTQSMFSDDVYYYHFKDIPNEIPSNNKT